MTGPALPGTSIVVANAPVPSTASAPPRPSAGIDHDKASSQPPIGPPAGFATLPEKEIPGASGSPSAGGARDSTGPGSRSTSSSTRSAYAPCDPRATIRTIWVRWRPSAGIENANEPSAATGSCPARSVPVTLQAMLPPGSAAVPRTSTTGARSLTSAGLVMARGICSAAAAAVGDRGENEQENPQHGGGTERRHGMIWMV